MKTIPKKELKNLTVGEGSAVNDGDNPPAKMVLVKSNGSASVMERMKNAFSRLVGKTEKDYGSDYGTPKTTSQIMAQDEFMQKFWTLKMAFMRSINSIMECAPAEDMGSMLGTTVEEFSAAASKLAVAADYSKAKELQDVLQELADNTGDTVDLTKVAAAVEKLEKFAVPEANTSKGDGEPVDETTNKETGKMDKKTITLEEALKGITDPAIKAVIEAQLNTVKAANEAKAADEKAAAEKAKADADKSKDELTKRFEAIEAQAKADREELVKLKEEKQEGEYLAKVRDLTVPGQTVSEAAKSLQEAYAVSKSCGDKLLKTFRAVSAQTTKHNSIFNAYGAAGAGVSGEETATGQVDKRAAELLADMRKTNPKATFEQAYVKAMEENKDVAAAAINNQEAVLA